MKLILQTAGSQEIRRLLAHAITHDIRTVRASAATLINQEDNLEECAIPVGSVEFVREAMRVTGISEPTPINYPSSLRSFLHREMQCLPKDRLPNGNWFLKPAGKTKLFDGFVNVFDDETDVGERSFRKEQREAFDRLPSTTPVFVSEIVNFVSEWRYYILKDKIVGAARYDDGDDDAPIPSEKTVKAMLSAYKKDDKTRPVAFGLDVGVLKSGETALVEVNDAWSLGLYQDMTDTAAYLEMLSRRWNQMMGNKPRAE